MDFIWSLIVATPWWVYVILIYVMIKGIKAFQTQDLPYAKIFIIPLLFLALGMSSLIHYLTNGSAPALDLLWLAGLAVGYVLNQLVLSNPIISVNHKQKTIKLKGSPWLLIYLLAIFSVKYYFGYQLAVYPDKINDMASMSIFLGFSGLFTGIFISKLWQYSQAIRNHLQGASQ